MRNSVNINEHHRLERLGDNFYPLDETFNVKGWTVVFDGGEVVGEVEELLVNPISNKVRYIVLNVDDACTSIACEKVLIPIGIAELHPEEDLIVLPGVGYSHLERLPAYDYQQIDDEMEMRIRLIFGPATHEEFVEPDPDQFYTHQQFDVERWYRNRKANG